ncbi:MAG TPA: ATP-binding protein, partial [Clostridiales bacterium]|nr:ATP-binding protein [Clostridiales bacterium]
TQILNALIVFANLLVTFTKASASAARINEVFDVTSSMQEGSGATMDESAPAIEMNDVSFAYAQNGDPFLKNVNLTVQKGDSVGILGGTGSGKTTLVSLMSRLYDATSGEVKIYGENVKNYTNAQLRQIFGVAPQKAVLFEGSVKDNLLWANENATDEDIENALETSQSAEFVNALKEGLDTQISQGGKNLSGGQRQRLTIARALVSNPDILILDDSSSALDFATDAKLRKALSHLRLEKGLTTVVVSQRATSIKYCDVIVVLDEGKIVGIGTHDELIKSCDVYKEICFSQNKGEENK